MKIIRAGENHLDLITPLFDAYRIFYGQSHDLVRAKNFISARLKNSDSIIFLITDEKELEAMAFAQLYPSFTSIGTSKIFILNDLYVKAEYRKNSVATQLLKHIKEFAQKNNAIRITLETALSNNIAQGLYESLGYKKEEGVLHFHLNL